MKYLLAIMLSAGLFAPSSAIGGPVRKLRGIVRAGLPRGNAVKGSDRPTPRCVDGKCKVR